MANDEGWWVRTMGGQKSYAQFSNANIYENNPGQQDLLLTIAAGF